MLLTERLVRSKEIRDAVIIDRTRQELHENMMSDRRTGLTPDIRIYVEAV